MKGNRIKIFRFTLPIFTLILAYLSQLKRRAEVF